MTRGWANKRDWKGIWDKGGKETKHESLYNK
jgi:hypothetical protein